MGKAARAARKIERAAKQELMKPEEEGYRRMTTEEELAVTKAAGAADRARLALHIKQRELEDALADQKIAQAQVAEAMKKLGVHPKDSAGIKKVGELLYVRTSPPKKDGKEIGFPAPPPAGQSAVPVEVTVTPIDKKK